MSSNVKDEVVLNEEPAWRAEAQAVIDDIKVGVKEAVTSETLLGSNSRIYINVTTLEDETFCIELTYRGFRIVGNAYDTVEGTSSPYYETPYALLNDRSVKFREAFHLDLMTKLTSLQNLSDSNDDTGEK